MMKNINPNAIHLVIGSGIYVVSHILTVGHDKIKNIIVTIITNIIVFKEPSKNDPLLLLFFDLSESGSDSESLHLDLLDLSVLLLDDFGLSDLLELDLSVLLFDDFGLSDLLELDLSVL